MLTKLNCQFVHVAISLSFEVTEIIKNLCIARNKIVLQSMLCYKSVFPLFN